MVNPVRPVARSSQATSRQPSSAAEIAAEVATAVAADIAGTCANAAIRRSNARARHHRRPTASATAPTPTVDHSTTGGTSAVTSAPVTSAPTATRGTITRRARATTSDRSVSSRTVVMMVAEPNAAISRLTPAQPAGRPAPPAHTSEARPLPMMNWKSAFAKLLVFSARPCSCSSSSFLMIALTPSSIPVELASPR